MRAIPPKHSTEEMARQSADLIGAVFNHGVKYGRHLEREAHQEEKRKLSGVFRYYCIACPPAVGKLPTDETLLKAVGYSERQYSAEIDAMVWGWVEFSALLTPKQISDFGLISAPREDEP